MTEGLRCPACPEPTPLSDTDIFLSGDVRLHRCSACGGVLACSDAVAIARYHYDRSHPLMVHRPSGHRCRACLTPANPKSNRCASCASSLLLGCPGCKKDMSLVTVVGVTIDACYTCKLAFFDRGEFAQVCGNPVAFSRAMKPVGVSKSSAWDYVDVAPDAGGLVVHAAEAAGHVAVSAAEKAAGAIGQADVGSAAEAAGGASINAAEVLAQGGEAAADAVLEVLAGVFSSF